MSAGRTKKRRAQIFFKMADLPTDGLRREVQLLRRPTDTTEAGNRPEVTEVLEVHVNTSEIAEILFTIIRLYQSLVSTYRKSVFIIHGLPMM